MATTSGSGYRGGQSTVISTGNFMANRPATLSSLEENFELGRKTAVDAMTSVPRAADGSMHDLRNFRRSQGVS